MNGWTEGMRSSDSAEWATPQWLFDYLDAEFDFDIDVCATPHNAKCLRYWTKEDDALDKQWGETLTHWMNPPYGDDILPFMRKAWEESLQGATVVCLVPFRADTEWWHLYAMRAHEIRFVRGRVHFIRDDGKTGSATFPSVVVIFRGGLHEWPPMVGPTIVTPMRGRRLSA